MHQYMQSSTRRWQPPCTVTTQQLRQRQMHNILCAVFQDLVKADPGLRGLVVTRYLVHAPKATNKKVAGELGLTAAEIAQFRAGDHPPELRCPRQKPASDRQLSFFFMSDATD